jgi:hypothetical protein
MQPKRYWFSAKTHGWGWGLPLVWQGWVVYGIAALVLVAAFFIFPPASRFIPLLGSTWAIALLLIAVCWLRGEPARWRWGK